MNAPLTTGGLIELLSLLVAVFALGFELGREWHRRDQ
jgi:hypothetical protein